MDDQLDIRTLGGLTILRNGVPIDGFDQRKVPALLVYLACNPRPHPREVLAELLWEDRTQPQSLSNLRVALSNLRITVGPFVEINRDTASMAGDGTWHLDAARFESRLADAGDDPDQLEEIVAFYQGEFLEGFYINSQGFEDWALLERERLRLRAMEALDRLMDCYLAQGRYANGRAQATRLLRIDPLREKTHRQLIQQLALAGEREAALAQYETCRQMLATEFGVPPTPATVTLYEQIRAGTLIPEPEAVTVQAQPEPGAEPVWQRPRHNLPVQSTSFVGREPDITAIIDQLRDPDCRLLTLVGPGGMGKTRLALAVAERLVDAFEHGVFFVPLAPLTTPDSIATAIAAAVQFQFYQSQDTTEQQLLYFLREKEMLLVLDNFEHLLDGVGIVDRILAAAPAITVLATSREPLNLGWEWLFEVCGMLHPRSSELDDFEDYSAVRLFVERARRVQPSFRLADESANVVRICQLVEGMPLGIEIAAAWLRLMPCEAIAAELLNLETLQRDVPERHHSLRALFDHTWQHLTAHEQNTFMKLSVFRGGFTQEAAEAVAQTTLPRLAALANKSLLHHDRISRRYGLHELVRQHAGEKLDRTGEFERSLGKHCAYYMDLLRHTGEHLRHGNFASALAVIRLDFDNFRVAWLHAAQNTDVQSIAMVMEDLRLFVSMSGLWSDGAVMFEQAATALESSVQSGSENGVILTELLARASWCHNFGGLPERATQLSERGRILIQRIGPRSDRPFALWFLWPENDERQTHLERLAAMQASGNLWGVGAAQLQLAHFTRHEGALDQAAQLYRHSLEALQRSGDHAMAFWPQLYLYRIAALQGKSAEVQSLLTQCFDIAEQFNSPFHKSVILVEMMMDAFFRDDLVEADRLAHEGYSLAHDVGAKVWAALSMYGLGRVRYSQHDYDCAVRIHEKGIVLANTDMSIQLPFFWQLGFTRTKQREFRMARAHFADAIKLVQKLPVKWPNAVAEWEADILAGVACLHAAEGDLNAALRYLSASLCYPTMWKYKQEEARLRAELEAEFGTDAVEVAIERGWERDMLEVAREVLAELEAGQ